MIHSRRAAIAGALAASLLPGRSIATQQREQFLFSYFTGSTEGAGMKLARSSDGLHFTEVKGGAVLLAPQVGETKLMRDPFLLKGQDGRWHMLWTTAWEGVTLGHASTSDFVHWTPQQAVPVMKDVPGTRNVWAPEMIWDAPRRQYVIFWSSTVTGRFTETAGASESGYNHRLWYTTTRDFKNFAPAKLFYDPGFSVIDATFIDHPRLGLHLIVKDETVNPPKKHLRVVKAASATGPFTDLAPPFTPDWVEGPTAIRIGEWTYVYFDKYREKAWGAMRSRDLRAWEDVSTQLHMPNGARHGTIVRAPSSLIETLG